jgi:hypothetical protein
VSRHCQSSPTCRRCSETGHVHRDCQAPVPCCVNCTKANQRSKRGYDVAHAADYSKCPCRSRELERLSAQIHYGGV